MWFPWPLRQKQPVTPVPRTISLRRTPQYVPRVLTADAPQKDLILQEPRINRAEARESLLRIAYNLHTVWAIGETDNSLMVQGPYYRWIFRKEGGGHFALHTIRDGQGQRASGPETWGKDPVQDLSSREKALIFRTLRELQHE